MRFNISALAGAVLPPCKTFRRARKIFPDADKFCRQEKCPLRRTYFFYFVTPFYAARCRRVQKNTRAAWERHGCNVLYSVRTVYFTRTFFFPTM